MFSSVLVVLDVRDEIGFKYPSIVVFFFQVNLFQVFVKKWKESLLLNISTCIIT